MRHIGKFALLSSAIALGAASPAFGQSATGETPSDTPNAGTQEIIVTAQKREERLIETPLSLSVVTGDDLERQAATQFRDFASSVPGLSFGTSGAGYTQISLRGVTAGIDVSSTVGVYVDEVPYGSSSAFAGGALYSLDVGLFDLDRVDVLRGPQGTLYGASTMGGLVGYVTKRPDPSGLEATIRGGLSGTAHGELNHDASAVLNVPLSSTAAVRFNAFEAHDGGFIDNVSRGERNVNSSDVRGGRVDLLLEPTDRLSMRIVGFAQNLSRDGEGATDYQLNGQPLDGPYDQRRLIAEPFDQKFRLVSGTINYDLDGATLTSVSSYQHMKLDYVQDVSAVSGLCVYIGQTCGAFGGARGATLDKFTQELRIAGDRTGAFEWLVGGFYTHESSDSTTAYVLQGVNGEPIPNTLYSLSAPSRFEEYAGFGNLTWYLSDRFDVTGGVRFAHNSQQFRQNGSGLLGSSTPERSASDNVVTYLANARFHLNSHAIVYARFATGYRPGGPNFVGLDPNTGLPAGPDTFEADSIKSYELGMKAESADGSLGADLSTYYLDWNNIQVQAVRGPFSLIANAPGGAEIYGAELSLRARPVSGLKLTGAFGYQHATLSKAVPDLGARAGERLPNVPRFTAAALADYAFDAGGLRWSVGATVRHVGPRNASFDANTGYAQYRLPDYSTVDLRAGVAIGSVDLQLYAKNLFDSRGQLSAWNWRGTAMPALLQPRTIGISIRAAFN